MIVTSVQIKTAKTQKHLYCPVFTSLFHNMEHTEEALDYSRVSLSNNPKFQAIFRVMSFVLAKNVYSLIKALYW